MTSDSSKSARRKHHRSSPPGDAEEHSKRHKHRHHRRHRHHHHGSKKDGQMTTITTTIGEIEADERKLEINDDICHEALVDYIMEEGEIAGDDGVVCDDSVKLEMNLDSDIESGEIKLNDNDSHTAHHEMMGGVDRKSSSLDRKSCGDLDQKIPSTYQVLSDGDYDRYYAQDDDDTPEPSKRSSRRQSILPDASCVGSAHKVDESYHLERERSDSGDEHIIDRGRRQRSKDDVYDKEKEHCSRKYAERRERHCDRESRERHRETSSERNMVRNARREELKGRDGESFKLKEKSRYDIEKEARVKEERLKEKEREKDRDGSRGWDRDKRVREERNNDRDNVRHNNRARSRDNRDDEYERNSWRRKYDNDVNGYREREDESRGRRTSDDYHRIRDDRDNEYEKNNRRRKYDNDVDGYRERENESISRKTSDNYHRDRSRRNNMQAVGSAVNTEEENKEIIESEEDKEEDTLKQDYDPDRALEESRRLREKHKILLQQTQSHSQGKDKLGNLSDQGPQAEGNVKHAEIQVQYPDNCGAETTFSVGKSPSLNALLISERTSRTGGLGEGTPKSERLDDMFHDDIFGESPAEVRKTGKVNGAAFEKSELNDNWDDAEGYYGYRFGETLDGRYEIIAAHGKGVFSTVVRARDLNAKPGHPEEVAIKIIRNNDTMYKAGMEELAILKKLVVADPDDKRHCVRYLSTFEYRNHLCLVFESLHMNLREVLKKFGRNIGLKLTAVRIYAKQLFIALKHLKSCGVLHCDIKPDNMLVNDAKNILKLCDFGSAMFAGKNEITPYLVSRFYRAPEIILGLPYDHPLDIWSVGCCLFELYTGKVLFPGSTNNEMLRLHMELKGPFPKKIIRKGAFTDQHFDQDLNFLATEEDPVTKKAMKRLLINIKPNDFGTLIVGYPEEDSKLVSNFRDLMEKIFMLDPDKRLTVSQALSHPFITGK